MLFELSGNTAKPKKLKMAEVVSLDVEIPSKKAKLDDSIQNNSISSDLIDLTDFNIVKILNNNTQRKHICVQGTFGDSKEIAVVLLEKPAFSEEDFKDNSVYFKEKTPLKKIFKNDIYGNYEFFPNTHLNSVKTTIIHPATAKHLEKYSIQNLYMVDETPEIYKEITLPHLAEGQLGLQWVYNILEHKSEVDRIVFEDTDEENGFVLLPDLKWDGKSWETLYLIAIVRARDLKSLRDLNATHLALLKNIKEKGEKAIKEKYGLDSSQLRVYLHYQPSFYHLHVHFTFLRYEAPGIAAARSHMLSSVISNIELVPDYYQKITLPFIVRESDKLFKSFEEAGFLTKVTF